MKSTSSAVEIAQAVNSTQSSAHSMIVETLARIEVNNGRINAFTEVLGERALAAATVVDAQVKMGKALPLAGVPFAVKNLYDVKGLTTRAGSKILRERPPADQDATLITRLEAAGAICVGATNMDEFAYGFAGENAHDGPVHNPHEVNHMAGGSSAGSAASNPCSTS
jgi:aspartyl-tRNA(Asn)/glutamyl-tRNA(Gln) amidotransferase subunit A